MPGLVNQPDTYSRPRRLKVTLVLINSFSGNDVGLGWPLGYPNPTHPYHLLCRE